MKLKYNSVKIAHMLFVWDAVDDSVRNSVKSRVWVSVKDPVSRSVRSPESVFFFIFGNRI